MWGCAAFEELKYREVACFKEERLLLRGATALLRYESGFIVTLIVWRDERFERYK